jgi:hypothetical protein
MGRILLVLTTNFPGCPHTLDGDEHARTKPVEFEHVTDDDFRRDSW